MTMVVGWMAPAPMPCTARNTIRASMLLADPHSSEPSANTTMPNSITGLRPNVSASAP